MHQETTKTIKEFPKIKDNLTGKKFNQLQVIKPVYQQDHFTYYLCKCSCGKEKILRGTNIKNGSVKSCGCLQKLAGKARKKHGLCKHPLYGVWSAMKARCLDENNENYGKRGIVVDSTWEKDFSAFYDWAIANNYEELREKALKEGTKISVDRINVNEGYLPENCRLITLAEQNRNKRNNKFYLYQGEDLLLIDIEKKSGVPESILWHHVSKGKTVEEAIEQYRPHIKIEDPKEYKETKKQLLILWNTNKELGIISKDMLAVAMFSKYPIKMVSEVTEKSQTTLYRIRNRLEKKG